MSYIVVHSTIVKQKMRETNQLKDTKLFYGLFYYMSDTKRLLPYNHNIKTKTSYNRLTLLPDLFRLLYISTCCVEVGGTLVPTGVS